MHTAFAKQICWIGIGGIFFFKHEAAISFHPTPSPVISCLRFYCLFSLDKNQWNWIGYRLFVLLVVYVYASIAPLVLPAAFLLFTGAYLVYKNQALYVYVQQAESGGAVSGSVSDFQSSEICRSFSSLDRASRNVTLTDKESANAR